jgi:hypothetical protein
LIVFKISSALLASKLSLAHPVHTPPDRGEIYPHLTGDLPK